MDNNPFNASWTEQGHTICLGHWEIFYQGCALKIPDAQLDQDMGTHGIYSFIYPDDPDFAEGLEEGEWVLDNIDWLTDLFLSEGIPVDEQHFRWFYRAVNATDWRCGSCGGCI